jgi:hypothetical protein
MSSEQQHQQHKRQRTALTATPRSHLEALAEIKRHCGERRSLDMAAKLPCLFAVLAAAVLATHFEVILQCWQQQHAVRNYITFELGAPSMKMNGHCCL